MLTAVVVVAGIWAARHRMLRVHPLLMPLAVTGAIVYMAMPRMLFASYLADQRLPIAIAFMAVACFRRRDAQEFVRRLFLVGTLGLLGARVAEVDIAWANAAPATLEMRESLRKVQKGSKILVAYTDSNMPNEVEHLGLVHAVSLAIIERQALITTAFTTNGKQIMHVRPEYPEDGRHRGRHAADDRPAGDRRRRPQTDDDSSYWHDWLKKYDYVYLLFTDEDSDNPMPDKLKTDVRGREFSALPDHQARHGRQRDGHAEEADQAERRRRRRAGGGAGGLAGRSAGSGWHAEAVIGPVTHTQAGTHAGCQMRPPRQFRLEPGSPRHLALGARQRWPTCSKIAAKMKRGRPATSTPRPA